MMTGEKQKGKRIEKLRRKYKLVLMDADSFEEKLSLRLTRLGVISVSFMLFLVFTVLTIYLIAFTSLREYIPGYADLSMPEKVYNLQLRADSLEQQFETNQLYVKNLKRIISGDSLDDIPKPTSMQASNYDTISDIRSEQDSLLRQEYEEQSKFNLYQNRSYNAAPPDLGKINFFPPLLGIITRKFDASQEHFGVDIVAKKSESIKAVLEGTVIFSDWTLETGYVIGLQHRGNLISVYKHNSSLLKAQGAYVKAGESISIVGESGELSTGPHLHFELWYNGTAIDPEMFVSF
jgi:murein DD-endopeptidase MepM/ murein hydrolase activator NlpD